MMVALDQGGGVHPRPGGVLRRAADVAGQVPHPGNGRSGKRGRPSAALTEEQKAAEEDQDDGGG